MANMNVEKISIALTPEMAGMLRQAVDSGAYATSSEVIRDALRDWKRKQDMAEAAVEELRRLVAEGIASGSKPWEGAEAIIAKARQRRAARSL